jgi:hypothetical protein
MTITTTQPPRLLLTGSADYIKLELAIPASAVDPETDKINADELLRHIALALDHDDGTPAEVVATLLAWSDHLMKLEEVDRWEAFLEWEAYIIKERGGPIPEEERARARAWLTIEVDDEDEETDTADRRAADVG